MSYELDVITALGGPSREESFQRVDAMVDLYGQGIAPLMVVTGAVWAFKSRQTGQTIGQAMSEYAVEQHGVPESDITLADRSFDTVGDALVIKNVMRSRGVYRLGYVTTASHVKRAGEVIEHVLGSDYEVHSYSAGEFPNRRFQRIYEMAGKVLTEAVLDGTEPGDDEAIMSRLFSLVPGYAEVSRVALIKNHIRRLLRLPLVQFEPSRRLTTHA